MRIALNECCMAYSLFRLGINFIFARFNFFLDADCVPADRLITHNTWVKGQAHMSHVDSMSVCGAFSRDQVQVEGYTNNMASLQTEIVKMHDRLPRQREMGNKGLLLID